MSVKMSIAAARLNAGFSQKGAAKRLGIAPTTLCAWERGTRKVPKVAVMAMSTLYDVPEDSFSLPEISAKS